MKYTNKNQTNTNSSNTANTSGTARKNHKRKAIAAIMTIALAMSASAYPLNSVHAVDRLTPISPPKSSPLSRYRHLIRLKRPANYWVS